MQYRALNPKHITYAKNRARGLTPPQAWKESGYTSYKTNAYRLENRPDIQAQIDTFRKQRAELMTAGEGVDIKAEDLSDLTVARTFLLQTLLDSLKQAQTQGDPKTVLQVVSKIVDLLSIQFDVSDLRRQDSKSTSDLLKQLEALK